MEYVSKHDILAAELTAAGAGNDVIKEIPIPPAATRWTVLVTPIDSGPAGTDPTAKFQYRSAGTWYDTNPVLSVPAVVNSANVTTREDVVNRIRLVLTLGTDPQPDGGVEVRLYIQRHN